MRENGKSETDKSIIYVPVLNVTDLVVSIVKLCKGTQENYCGGCKALQSREIIPNLYA